jgi:hypothetical protein
MQRKYERMLEQQEGFWLLSVLLFFFKIANKLFCSFDYANYIN